MTTLCLRSYDVPTVAAVSFARQYTDEQRQAIYELKAEDPSRTGKQLVAMCAAGVKGLEPFSPSPESAIRIAREEAAERDDASLSPAAKEPDHREAFRKLVRETISVTERQIAQLRRDQARSKVTDRARIAKTTESLIGSLIRLQKLIEATPSKPEENGKPEQPAGFLERLAAQ